RSRSRSDAALPRARARWVARPGSFPQRARAPRPSLRWPNDRRERAVCTRRGTAQVPKPGPGEGKDYVVLFGAVAQILARTVAIIVVPTRRGQERHPAIADAHG